MTTRAKANDIASRIYALDKEPGHAALDLVERFSDVVVNKGAFVEVSERREDQPRVNELNRELSLLLGESEPPTGTPANWHYTEVEKALALLLYSYGDAALWAACNIRNCDSNNKDYFQVISARTTPGENGITLILRDHEGEDLKFKVKVERS